MENYTDLNAKMKNYLWAVVIKHYRQGLKKSCTELRILSLKYGLTTPEQVTGVKDEGFSLTAYELQEIPFYRELDFAVGELFDVTEVDPGDESPHLKRLISIASRVSTHFELGDLLKLTESDKVKLTLSKEYGDRYGGGEVLNLRTHSLTPYEEAFRDRLQRSLDEAYSKLTDGAFVCRELNLRTKLTFDEIDVLENTYHTHREKIDRQFAYTNFLDTVRTWCLQPTQYAALHMIVYYYSGKILEGLKTVIEINKLLAPHTFKLLKLLQSGEEYSAEFYDLLPKPREDRASYLVYLNTYLVNLPNEVKPHYSKVGYAKDQARLQQLTEASSMSTPQKAAIYGRIGYPTKESREEYKLSLKPSKFPHYVGDIVEEINRGAVKPARFFSKAHLKVIKTIAGRTFS